MTEIKSFTSGIALQWLHLQALLQSTFGLVSALVFSVQNVLSPTVIWLILFSFFSDICQLFEHYCQYSSTSYLPGSDEYLYLSNYG